ncbi:hypothetical protein [Hymenobacter lapidiphilus]|uniref:Uncharacterized protein n=1 Tax=Hymenobacter lapidiphilus TaxID=2608003 RepID=A0A7Y7PSW7_9BACT|nr:hypothetical protein [Hymenobacter lapidiphilus]NVO33214.1 hypothetical protein [Hymenobacter lapidiphilus]
MPTNLDCLTDLLGITAADSACFPLPADAAIAARLTASATGVYADQTPGLSLRNAPNAQSAQDVYQRLESARSQALQDVAHRLGARSGNYRARFAGSGLLGGLGNGQYEAATATATFQTIARPGGALRIDSLTLYTDQPATDVALLLDGQPVGTLPLTGQAYTPAQPLLIPLDGQAHTLTASLPEGVRVRVNVLTCGCANPFVGAMRLSLTDVKARAGGFGLDVTEVCTAGTPLCYALALPGEDGEELRRSAALALQRLTAAYFVASLIPDSQYNRYTMLEPKQLNELGQQFTEYAETHLLWLLGPDGLERAAHPCYVCQPAAWHPTVQHVR